MISVSSSTALFFTHPLEPRIVRILTSVASSNREPLEVIAVVPVLVIELS